MSFGEMEKWVSKQPRLIESALELFTNEVIIKSDAIDYDPISNKWHGILTNIPAQSKPVTNGVTFKNARIAFPPYGKPGRSINEIARIMKTNGLPSRYDKLIGILGGFEDEGLITCTIVNQRRLYNLAAVEVE